MTRREALVCLTALFGGTVFGAHRFLAGTAYAADGRPDLGLTPEDLELLSEVAETIVPATKTSGGAKAAKIADFIQEIARDFYDDAERVILLSAPKFFRDAAAEKHPGHDFVALSAVQRHGLLVELDRRAPQPDAYRMVKQLTLWGYWTSEVAAKQALTYMPVPGQFRGCIKVEPDAKAIF